MNTLGADTGLQRSFAAGADCVIISSVDAKSAVLKPGCLWEKVVLGDLSFGNFIQIEIIHTIYAGRFLMEVRVPNRIGWNRLLSTMATTHIYVAQRLHIARQDVRKAIVGKQFKASLVSSISDFDFPALLLMKLNTLIAKKIVRVLVLLMQDSLTVLQHLGKDLQVLVAESLLLSCTPPHWWFSLRQVYLLGFYN